MCIKLLAYVFIFCKCVDIQVVPSTIQKMLPMLSENFWDFYDKEPERVGPMFYTFSKAVGADIWARCGWVRGWVRG